MSIEKFSKITKKYLVYFVVIDIITAVIFGYYYPTLAKGLKRYVYIPIFLMLIPMMTSANISGIGEAFKSPKIVISAIILNFIITPRLGYLFAKVFYAGQPTLLPVVFIPTWMWILTHTWVNVPIELIFKDLSIIVVIPIIIGYLLHRWIVQKWGEERFLEIKPVFPGVSSLGMYMIVFMAMATVAIKIVKNPYYIVLVAVSMGVYYFVLFTVSVVWSKLCRIRHEEAVALTYSVTAKNLSITIALATVTWGGLAVLVPAFNPVIQVPVMIIILSVSKHLKKYFEFGERSVSKSV